MSEPGSQQAGARGRRDSTGEKHAAKVKVKKIAAGVTRSTLNTTVEASCQGSLLPQVLGRRPVNDTGCFQACELQYFADARCSADLRGPARISQFQKKIYALRRSFLDARRGEREGRRLVPN